MVAQARVDVHETKDLVMIHERKDIMVAAGHVLESTGGGRQERLIELCAAGPDLLFESRTLPATPQSEPDRGSVQGYVCEPMN